MIQMEIPRDIRKFESKLIGPFTTRQTIFLGLGSVLAILVYFALGFLAMDARISVAVIIALPIVMFGFLKPFGMHLEHFLLVAFISNVLSPRIRLYKTANPYAKKVKPITQKEMKKKIKQLKKSNNVELCAYK